MVNMIINKLNSVDLESISITAMDVATIEGVTVLLKRYGRDRCRRISIISRLPDVNPPEAPPKALPRVDVIISTLPITLQ